MAIYIWAGWAFAGAAIMAILWNTTSGKVGLMPGIVPKLAAMVTLGLAGEAAGWAGQPVVIPVATIAAAGCLVGTLVSRWAAALPRWSWRRQPDLCFRIVRARHKHR